ncbi:MULTISPECIES: hypothetical protein [unclassified Staphylococcus]|uniref:hypothetical protein n=1 Tax=unclassified Staphylococcus TaxID=91994 RepID=UPI001AEBF9B8|nr:MULTISPECIES: hypothetical protein [unclassified Staphylococcus]
MAAKNDKQKALSENYQSLYGYTLDEIVDQYENIIEVAEKDPQTLANLYYIFSFSDRFETPMYNHMDQDVIVGMIQNYIADDEEKTEEMDNYLRNSNKLFRSIMKRSTDWIIRQQKAYRVIQSSIIKLLESDYKLSKEALNHLQVELYNAGIRHQESQLDLITLKAIKDITPSFEMELFLKKYNQDVKTLMSRWNQHNNKYNQKSHKSVGFYDLFHADVSDILYKNKLDLIKDDFYNQVDSYGAEFINDDNFREDVFKIGGVLNGQSK